MPPKMTAQAAKSSFPGLLRKNRAENSMTNTGTVNWSTMALAAVVSLLATENRELVANTASAPSSTQRLNFNGCLDAAM